MQLYSIEIHYCGHSIRCQIEAKSEEHAVERVLKEIDVYVETNEDQENANVPSVS